MLLSHTQTTTIYKVRAYANIDGNEKTNKLAKRGCKLRYKDAKFPHKFAHLISYYLQKDWRHSIDQNIQQKLHLILRKTYFQT